MPSGPLRNSAAPMIARLYMSGAIAATANRLYEFSTLEQNVLTANTAGETSRMRVNVATVSRNAGSVEPGTQMSMMGRAKIARTMDVKAATRKKTLMTALVRYHASSSSPTAW